MLKAIETTGKNEEEAIAAALRELGKGRDEVSVEILERSKSGFLGIGAVPARVRVSYEYLESNADKAEAFLKGLLERLGSDAVPVVESGTEEEIRQRLQAIGQAMPIVTIGPRVEGVSCVNITSDLSLSVRKSITHLYALGHRRISFIGGSGGVRSSSARRRGIRPVWRSWSRPGMRAPAPRGTVSPVQSDSEAW